MKRILKGINEISPSVLLLSHLLKKKVEHQEKKETWNFDFPIAIDYFQSLELLWIFAEIIFWKNIILQAKSWTSFCVVYLRTVLKVQFLANK